MYIYLYNISIHKEGVEKMKKKEIVVGVGNQKGGVGKTTIATNMSCLYAKTGQKTLLIDADSQESSLLFRQARPDDKAQFHAVAIPTDTIHKDISGLNFETCIIDAGGRDNKAFRSAVFASDVLLIPITPSPYDIWSSEDTFKMFDEIRHTKESVGKNMKGAIVLNMIQPNVKITNDVYEALKEMSEKYGLSVLDTKLAFRVAYKESANEGLSVTEMIGEKFKKASDEVTSLFHEIKKL